MPKPEPHLVEQEHHRRAFTVYCALGNVRSLASVAKELGVSLAAVKLWSSQFTWRQRLADQQAADTRHLADRHRQQSIDENERNRRLTKMALLKVAKDIAEGRIKTQMADLPRLIELDRLLSGETGPRRGPGAEDVDLLQAYIRSLDTPTLERVAAALEADASKPAGEVNKPDAPMSEDLNETPTAPPEVTASDHAQT